MRKGGEAPTDVEVSLRLRVCGQIIDFGPKYVTGSAAAFVPHNAIHLAFCSSSIFQVRRTISGGEGLFVS